MGVKNAMCLYQSRDARNLSPHGNEIQADENRRDKEALSPHKVPKFPEVVQFCFARIIITNDGSSLKAFRKRIRIASKFQFHRIELYSISYAA